MSKFIEIKLNPGIPGNKYKKLNPKRCEAISNIIKRKLRGQTVIHINSTPYGGGVAELLRSQVYLENFLGLESHWLAIKTRKQFFNITKKMHNLLQGKPGAITEEEKVLYLSVNRDLGQSLQDFCQRLKKGIIVIHDPQPLPCVNFVPRNFSAILRLHIDLSTPNAATLDFLRPFIQRYSAVILSNRDYSLSLPWLSKKKIKIIAPAIDPFTEKNRPMELRSAQSILEEFGIETSKPLVTQVSRFDPWKDPLGVIRAYYFAKMKIPDLQLVLAGFFAAKDDPEAVTVFEKVKKHARGDPDIFLFLNPRKLKTISNDNFINALYTASDIVVQKSIREGFGLTITEALWKKKAVIAGATSGSKLQIKNGCSGILVSSPEETARAIVRLLKNKKLSAKLGKAGRRAVKQKFLLPRFVLENAKVYTNVLKAE